MSQDRVPPSVLGRSVGECSREQKVQGWQTKRTGSSITEAQRALKQQPQVKVIPRPLARRWQQQWPARELHMSPGLHGGPKGRVAGAH